MPFDLFISYSHADKDLHERLEKHLKPLVYEDLINQWSDREIITGADFGEEIMSQLNKAAIILLCISPDFIDSNYCWGIEVKRAMARHDTESARVIPVIFRPVHWKNLPFGKLLGVPSDGKPITMWTNQDEAFLEVAKAIRTTTTWLKDAPLRHRALETSTVWIETKGLSSTCDIFVDDSFAQEIGGSSRVSIRLAPGEHNVQLFGFPRQKSNKVFFKTSRNESITLVASIANISAFEAMTAGFGLGEMFVLKTQG